MWPHFTDRETEVPRSEANRRSEVEFTRKKNAHPLSCDIGSGPSSPEPISSAGSVLGRATPADWAATLTQLPLDLREPHFRREDGSQAFAEED